MKTLKQKIIGILEKYADRKKEKFNPSKIPNPNFYANQILEETKKEILGEIKNVLSCWIYPQRGNIVGVKIGLSNKESTRGDCQKIIKRIVKEIIKKI